MCDRSPLTFAPISEGLRVAFAHNVQELRAEVHELEEGVAEAKRRLDNAIALLAVLDAPAIPETVQ
jgi:hypothetical protein